ncbi:AAA family ATPase [Bradyrhizobium sp. SZCCHNRI1073]|uniref:AAA family ATPase n=1 Tax=Bradyrhizobium sp. SZCCHNRI1073 TaxID=3057280 RepID=UPI00291636B6|nr:AAA family ATPase [Bradyrhizobium sp. SZCCHNRI1073]
MKTLGPIGIEAFERRSISAETAARFAIYTASRTLDGEVVPDSAGNIVVFPFVEHGAVVNEKYRAPGKKFWQRGGGRRTFWNADALDDPGLESGHLSLVITEGEIDALTAIECGFPLSVSVPDGAPGVADGEDPADLQPIIDEASGKFEFLWNNRDRLKRIKRFIIAVDNDRPGQRLAAELVRRLSASRCMFVEYPLGCKDLNDVACQRGPEAVAAVLNAAKPYPVRGLYQLSDYPERGPLPTYSTGWWTLDKHLKLFTGEFMVVTGIPSHGKSTWVMNLLCNAASLHGWRSVIFSPEMPTVPHLRDKFRKIKGGARCDADAFICEYFRFIDADPTGDNDDDFDLDWIIDRATDAVLRDGIRCLVIDPWNEIEHARRKDESMTDYIGRGIRALKRFARLYDVAVIVIAHPTKEVGKDGKSRPVTLYDIEGSAHWFNKCDHGVVIDRPNAYANESIIRVAKCRFEESGEKGEVVMSFDRERCRFLTLDRSEFDHLQQEAAE